MTPPLGIFLVQDASGVPGVLELARRADAGWLDLIGFQDHPYQRRFLDAWALMATLLASDPASRRDSPPSRPPELTVISTSGALAPAHR